MKAIEMQPLKAYIATTPSPDKTIWVGAVLWVSENGYLNCFQGRGAWLEEEWKSKETVDFEVEETDKYKIEVKSGDYERCIKLMPEFGCEFKDFMNEPISCAWTKEDVLKEYDRYQDKKIVSKIWGITTTEVAKILKERNNEPIY